MKLSEEHRGAILRKLLPPENRRSVPSFPMKLDDNEERVDVWRP
jgi:hypothetical protein